MTTPTHFIGKDLCDDPRKAEIIDLVGIEAMVEDFKTRGAGGTGVAAFSSPG